MNNKDFFDLDDLVRDTMKNALNAIGLDRLKNDITDKAENTINEVKENLRDKAQQFNEKIENQTKYQYRNILNTMKKEKNEVQLYTSKRPVGSISGVLYIIFGSIFSVTSGVLLIAYYIFTSIFSKFLIANYIGLGILFLLLAVSTAFVLRGINLRKRTKRFKQYVNSLGNRGYCSIEKLASAVEKKNKFVVKDLKKMIELDMFKEGHIDEKETCFMLNNEIYENYLSSQESFKKRTEQEVKKQEKLDKEANDPEKVELRKTIEIGQNYIKQIKELNDSIIGGEISSKLHRLQEIVSQIFNYIENNPKKLFEVNKFTNHYIPITLKLVNAYQELNEQQVQGENIRNAKNQIENTIDTINIAFEKLLDDLFEDVVLDISTDISVLETLFTQEGLTKKDFKK